MMRSYTFVNIGLFRKVFLVIVLMFISSVIISTPSYAAKYTGYFHPDVSHDVDGSNLLQYCGGVAPFNSTMVDKVILKNRLVQYRTGGACSNVASNFSVKFITQSMMNHANKTYSSTFGYVVDDEWNSWVSSVVNNSDVGVVWYEDYPYTKNTMCYSNHGCGSSVTVENVWNSTYKFWDNLDAYVWSDTSSNPTADALVFYYKSTNQVFYVLKFDCANPLWNYVALTPSWTVTPKSEVSVNGGTYHTGDVTAYPGDTIKWRNTITNNGIDTTDNGLTYHYDNNTALTSRAGTSHGGDYSGVGILSGHSSSTETKLIGSASFVANDTTDIDSKFCRTTTASQGIRGGGESSPSAPACVTVLKKPVNWTISPSTELYVGATKKATATSSSGEKVVDVKVNNIVSWINSITNTGTTATDQNITYRYRNSSQALIDRAATDQGVIHTVGSLGILASDSFPSYLRSLLPFKIKPEDVNKKFCRNTIAYQKSSSNRTDSISTNNACAYVPYDYNLTPTIGINPSGSAAVGQDIIITPKVYNNGPTDSDVRGWVVQVTINGVYKPDHKTGNESFPVSATTDLMSHNYTVGTGLTPGDKLCFILWLDKSSPSGGPIASSLACVVIGKIPNIQVWGGDVWARDNVKGIQTHSSSVGTQLFGSWAEYGILTSGPIIQMGSGSAFANAFSASGTVCEYSILSFTNAGCSSNVGHYSISRNVPDIKANFASATTTLPSNNLSGLNGKYGLTASDFEITGGDIAAGNSVIIYAPNTDIKISGDIKYTTGLITGGVQSIPQVVIIAQNVFIAENVENIDAWLMANGGIINTCAYNAGGAVIDPNTIRISYTGAAVNCDKKLTVNGPVAAKKLLLYRTNGADSITGYANASEVFNLRADAYLWAAAQSTSSTSIKTVYTIEQPPRF